MKKIEYKAPEMEVIKVKICQPLLMGSTGDSDLPVVDE